MYNLIQNKIIYFNLPITFIPHETLCINKRFLVAARTINTANWYIAEI